MPIHTSQSLCRPLHKHLQGSSVPSSATLLNHAQWQNQSSYGLVPARLDGRTGAVTAVPSKAQWRSQSSYSQGVTDMCLCYIEQGSMDESRAVTVNTGLRKLLHFESLQAVKAEQLQLKQPMDSI